MNIKGNVKNLIPIRKGEVRNPTGRPKIPENITELRKNRKLELETLIYELHDMNKEELGAVMKDPTSSALKIQLASQMIFAIKEGDVARMNMHLTWAFGKPTNHVELSGPDGGPISMNHNHSGKIESDLKDYTDRELIALVKKSKEVLGKLEDGQDLLIDDLKYFMDDIEEEAE